MYMYVCVYICVCIYIYKYKTEEFDLYLKHNIVNQIYTMKA